jgi:hypothetical protein
MVHILSKKSDWSPLPLMIAPGLDLCDGRQAKITLVRTDVLQLAASGPSMQLESLKKKGNRDLRVPKVDR